MTLCTQIDVEQRLQWDITNPSEPVITTLITDAQALIESAIGRDVESAAWTETLDAERTLFLKYWPVTTMTSVTEDGTALTVVDDVLWYADGRVMRASSSRQIAWGTSKRQSIVVSYTGGYLAGTHDTQLEHLGGVCAEVVARAFRQGAASADNPAGTGLGGITSVALDGSDTVSFGTVNGATIELGGGLSRFMFLLDSEHDDIIRYRDVMVG